MASSEDERDETIRALLALVVKFDEQEGQALEVADGAVGIAGRLIELASDAAGASPAGTESRRLQRAIEVEATKVLALRPSLAALIEGHKRVSAAVRGLQGKAQV